MERLLDAAGSGAVPGDADRAIRRLVGLQGLRRIGREIEETWLEPKNRRLACWADHEDINTVMLATSLIPESYLKA